MTGLGPVTWPPAPIATERLVLRPPETRDRAAFIELHASPEVGAYIGGARPRDEVERAMPETPERRPGLFAVELGGAMIGTVEAPDHHFYGITFVHPELSTTRIAGRPEFAGFVSSIIESGTNASSMEAVRSELTAAGIDPYDAFSPEIMDIIAFHRVKIATQPSLEVAAE